MVRVRRIRQVSLVLLLMLWGGGARGVMGQVWGGREGEEQPPQQASLRAVWSEADHPSGVYYAKANGNLQVMMENSSEQALPLEGTIAFGAQAKSAADFKALALTPIAATTLGARERVKLPLPVTFGAAGPYELRWVHADKTWTVIESNAGVGLQAIFAPRSANMGTLPWLTPLPRQAALVPGYLADLVAQTTVQRFLLDERFAFDPSSNIGLAAGASLGISAEQAQVLFGDVGKAKAVLILRVSVPVAHPASGKTLAAFRQYIADAAVRMGGTLKGIAIVPEAGVPAGFTAEQRVTFRDFYLAGYEAAKKHDKNIAFLGAGAAQETLDLLLTPTAPGKTDDLRAYVDALAITDVVNQPAIAMQARGEGKLPLWILPPASADPWPLVPAAAALAEEAVVVPLAPPSVDRGVTAHLLGGAVFFQKVHPLNLPYVAVFQGDGYAVAAIAGLAACTPIDALYPSLARTRTVVTSRENDGKPGYASVEVPDDTRSLRVVDAAGLPIDCRVGDMLFVPAADRVVYMLQTGSAEDLSALLRPAGVNRLPVMEMAATLATLVEGESKKPAITLRLTNITLDEMGGTVKIVVPASGEQKASITLAENAVVPISAGKSLELTLPLAGAVPTTPVIVEFTTRRVIQRTAVMLGGSPGTRGAETRP